MNQGRYELRVSVFILTPSSARAEPHITCNTDSRSGALASLRLDPGGTHDLAPRALVFPRAVCQFLGCTPAKAVAPAELQRLLVEFRIAHHRLDSAVQALHHLLRHAL